MGTTQSSDINGLSTIPGSKLSFNNEKLSTFDSLLKKHHCSERWNLSENGSNKQKISKFGSIRRKLARKNKKGSDYRKHICELLQTWSSKDVSLFIRQYEALDALRNLHRSTASARKSPSSLPSDMAHLYENNYCSDLAIKFHGSIFHVHRSILSARCKLFDTHLTKNNVTEPIIGNIIELSKEDFSFSSQIFSSLLKYIYCGFTKDRQLIEVLGDLTNKYGVLNSLNESMKEILECSFHADLVLIFPSMPKITEKNRVEESNLVDNSFEVFCHSSILCARSSYFRKILQEKFCKQESCLVHLVLSEKIIPRTFIKVILDCMYTDVLNLTSIIKWKVADDGSGEADRLLTIAELAMELYEIGCFIDFPFMMSACEDIITKHFDVSILLVVFEWSSQPYGSKYVYRQAINYFLDEFSMLCRVPSFLANIPKDILISAIGSDFLQATEELILEIVVKWGEWQIAKSNDKLCLSSINSLPKWNPRKRDMNNEVLREKILDLLANVRLQHILPITSPVLQSVCQRRLLLQDPLFDIGNYKMLPTMVFWLREYKHPEYLRPRLFFPYVEEAKLVLNEKVTVECFHPTISLPSQCMPDMLPSNHTNECIMKFCNLSHGSPSSNWVDVSQLDPILVKCIILREKELKSSSEVLHALALSPDNAEISIELQLRVIREFGLPDELALHIFKQNPDLIEVDLSSRLSVQSTLSKVGLLMSYEQHAISSRVAGVHDHENSALNCYIETPDQNVKSNDFDSQSLIMLNSLLNVFEDTEKSLCNRMVTSCSIRDSPLDLPNQILHLADNQLPNVLLDT